MVCLYAMRKNLDGPHCRLFDLSVFMNGKVLKRTTLQFRAESHNLNSKPNF